MTTQVKYYFDRVIIAAVLGVWIACTFGYYSLFKAAADATSVVVKCSLFIAAFLAVGYSFITFVLMVVLPISHIGKWVIRKFNF